MILIGSPRIFPKHINIFWACALHCRENGCIRGVSSACAVLFLVYVYYKALWCRFSERYKVRTFRFNTVCPDTPFFSPFSTRDVHFFIEWVGKVNSVQRLDLIMGDLEFDINTILLFLIVFVLLVIVIVMIWFFRRWNRLFLLWSTDLCRDTMDR